MLKNASAAFLEAVRLSMRAVRNALSSATTDPALLTAAERLQHEGFLRREDTTRQILALKEAGHSIKEIMRRTHGTAASWCGKPSEAPGATCSV